MIIEAVINLVTTLIHAVFGFINIPAMPEGIETSINYVFDLLFNGVQFLGFVMHWEVVKVLLPILLAVLVLEQAYHVIMWIIRKLPFLGMS